MASQGQRQSGKLDIKGYMAIPNCQKEGQDFID